MFYRKTSISINSEAYASECFLGTDSDVITVTRIYTVYLIKNICWRLF